MRSRTVASVLIALSAVTAAVAVRRLGARSRRAVPAPAPAPAVVETGTDAVVLAFPRPAVVEPVAVPAPAAPARCGDSGGTTKAGAPCGARATSSGRCHHHRIAA